MPAIQDVSDQHLKPVLLGWHLPSMANSTVNAEKPMNCIGLRPQESMRQKVA